MKAIVIEKTGGVENLIHTNIDKPKASKNEVLIKVDTISINPVDFKVRAIEELLNMICGEGYPAILGWDIAGEVVELGANTNQFNIGDKVFGMVNFLGRGNAYAEFVAAPQNHLAKIPEGISSESAAVTTLAALTALQALQNNIKSGDKVLIHAGAGGVGHFAIQIAKHLGAYVATTTSAKNKDFVEQLGVDEHIDYQNQAFEKVLTDYDFVLDGVGGDEILLNSIKVLKQGGQLISLPSPAFSDKVMQTAEERNINLSFMMVQSNGEDMNTLAQFLENGTLKPHVSKIFSFSEMDKAHLQLETSRTVGKVVVKI